MQTPMNMSRDTALRIALAARVLPGIGVGRLLEMLHQSIEGPLTEESLQTVTVTNLKTGFASADGEEDGEDISVGLPAIKDAVRILWGETVDSDLPQPVVLDTLPERSIRVAIASNSGENLDGHFGSCLRFLIYQVSAEEKALVDVRSALEADFSDDRNGFRVDLIRDCQVLYVVSVGGPAAAKVVRADIYPMKRIEGGMAADILAELQAVMAGSPPPWLAKLLGVAAEQRVRFSRSDEVL
ncbi:nitrogen fixation protein NifX [Pseudomonas linyingensis]|uniref:Nitrogen fixation protein NifX n=1 Tax=Pseudomonas linyingensis TaxID=915471 RepID=A0A1H7BR35_9PSED|nr:dinitrogenase iron-molybdenum cofactor biosynthesis protein [Pseudomonas linyingensis]SEJ79484.1 nitrogen fixation protein NifX [Pseudomonas linyingensis]